jgi:hypothetical protein
MNILNEGVMDYVNVMAKQGTQMAGANLNSDQNILNRELIEFYKNNPIKANATINSATTGTFSSPEHRMHVQAANIAINGYSSKPLHNEPARVPGLSNQETEISKLNKAGWKPLNEQKNTELLLG